MPELVARTLADGLGRTEGPVLRTDGEIVVVSMDRGKVYAIKDGQARTLAEPGHFPNGATEGLDGTIYITQMGGKRWGPAAGTGGVQKVGRDGSVSWLTQDPISPNDLCFGPDGFLYITDPTRPMSRNDGRLFRCNIETGEAELLCSVPWYPNGIGFGMDDALYVARSGQHRIMRFSWDDGHLGKEETFVQMSTLCTPDGFTFDTEGNIIVASNSHCDHSGRIQTFDRNGVQIDTFLPGTNKLYTNVALSPDRVLIITNADGGRVLTVDHWPYAGLPLYPFRKKN